MTRPALPLLLAGALALPPITALAALACDLNDPERDVPRLFPEATSYKTRYVSITGDLMLRRIEARLGTPYVALYAPLSVPYTLYELFRAGKRIGFIHGVNQKGQFGAIQVFMAQDLTGRVKAFYIQKITGASASGFRSAAFAAKFVGVTLRDFDTYDPATGEGSGRIAKIANPVPEMETDFYGILRGLKKNLILMDELVFSAERGSP